MIKTLTSLTILSFWTTMLHAAPMDTNGDGTSDVTVVEADSNLNWKAIVNNVESSLTDNFGELGDHLMPGHYDGDSSTNLAFVDDEGTWTIRGESSDSTIQFGDDAATFIGGGDFDGDGRDDLAYRTSACVRRPSTLHVMTNVLGVQETLAIRAGRGRFYSMYGDVNGDGTDEFCFLRPRRAGTTFRGTFTAVCKDVVSNNAVATFRVGKVVGEPLPIKQNNGEPDLFALVRKTSERTTVIVRNVLGAVVQKVRYDAPTTVVIGNFTNDDASAEQIGFYADSSDELYVHDLDSETGSTIAAPVGIIVDEINNVHFQSANSCYCTAKTIRRNNGTCGSPNSGGNSEGVIAGSCGSFRDITDGSGNFLHKPVADGRNEIVNLFPRSDDPSTCWYENQSNTLIGNAYFTGYSNPDRPTFRPTGGISCGSLPANFIVACNVQGQKYCWQIPDPCTRYD